MKKYLIFFFFSLLLFANNDRGLYFKKYANESKIALVIGNNDYEFFTKLRNPINDAKSIKNILETKGFKVHYLENATLRQMEKKIRKFSYDLKNGGVGMIYYAGHGIEVEGNNYLIPINAEIIDKSDVKYQAIPVNMIIDKMENAQNRLNILVLDACRFDPFSRSSSGGLAAINNAKGMYVAYATAPGEVASDGGENNGLFTKHLLTQINKIQTLEEVFKNTRMNVYEESNGKQIPWTSSSIMGEFYFTINNSAEKEDKESVKRIENSSTFEFTNKIENKFNLKIFTVPEDSSIIIKNSNITYDKNLSLPKGHYEIEVSKKGYLTKTGVIDLSSDISININLDKIQEKIISKAISPTINKLENMKTNEITKNSVLFLGDRFVNKKVTKEGVCSRIFANTFKNFLSSHKELNISNVSCQKHFPDIERLHVNVNEFFVKKGWFSNLKPNLEKLNKYCLETNNNYIVFADGEISSSDASFNIYNYNCNSKELKDKSIYSHIIHLDIVSKKAYEELFSIN